MKTDNTFFEEAKEHSLLKTDIVAKYFAAWANVIVPLVNKREGRKARIGYFDLYAGAGMYADGTESTPVRIRKQATVREDVRRALVTIYDDADAENYDRLKKAISEIPGIDQLAYTPKVYNQQVGEDVIRLFSDMRMIPSVIFLDPWGYKGLCLDLINSVVKDWACECIFFFNYQRVNAAVNNELLMRHVDGLFGAERAERLRAATNTRLSSSGREELILGELVQALKEKHGRFVLKFRFRNPEKDRTSHYLIFVTKDVLGHDIMKAIMAKASSGTEQGVPSFEYNPCPPPDDGIFLGPLDDLMVQLRTTMAGRRMTMKQVFNEHNVGTRFISANYKTALRKLEEAGYLTACPPLAERRNNTFSDSTVVTFPAAP